MWFIAAEFAGCPYTGPLQSPEHIKMYFRHPSMVFRYQENSSRMPQGMTSHFAASSCDASFCCITADKSIPWPSHLTPVALTPSSSLAHGEFFPLREGTRGVFC